MVINEPIIEPEFQGLNLEETIETISKMYPEYFNFILEDLKKTQIFYEFILVDTKSVEITHVPDKKDLSIIAYSKLKIFKALNPIHWNQGIYRKNLFPNPLFHNIIISGLDKSLV